MSDDRLAAARRPADLRRAAALFREVDPPRRLIGLAAGTMLVQGALGLLQPWPLKFLVDDVIPRGGGRDLALVLGAAAAIAVCGVLAKTVHARAKTELGLATVVGLRNLLFGHLTRLSLAFHDRQRVGELANRLGSNTYSLWTLTDAVLFAPAAAVLTLLGAIALMLALDWRLGAIALAITPALFVAIRRYAQRSREVARAFHDREGELWARAEESLQAVRVIQAFAREDHEQRRFESASGSITEARLRMIDIDNRFAMASDLIIAAGTIAIMGLGALSVRDGRLTTGELLVFITYLAMLYGPLSTLSYLAGTVSAGLAGLERVTEVLDEMPEVRDRDGARPLPSRSEHGRAFPVELRAASFAYAAGGPPALHDVSFRAEPGELTAIIGATGAGKSTLLSLIPRFYDATGGVVLIGGLDVRDVRLRELRASIAIVLQESFLFDASIRENIAYGRPGASQEEIEAAARRAQALDFIRALPGGFDTRVGARGVRLSGGERQRIAIARAFLKDAPILILDEPTASLDVNTEAALLESLRELMKDRTTFLVTHRLALAERADRVLVVEKGRVAERSPREGLAAVREAT